MTNQQPPIRSFPQISIDTKTIQDRLSTCTIGEIIPYSILSELIGRDVQGPARSNLMSAMRRLVAEGKVFGTVRGVGVKRLSDQEIVGLGTETINRVRRSANKTRNKIAQVANFETLPEESKVSHNTSLSILSVLVHMTKPSTVKQLESKIEQVKIALPLARTLEALSKT